MRSSVRFSAPTTTSSSSSSLSPPSFSLTHQVHSHSPWHSPVPYLFGGLAAMLGLIAFALLILACSYWKLSGFLDGGEDGGDVESGGADGGKASDVKPVLAPYEERILVIMAGDEKPTYLAMPISSQASSFGKHGGSADGKCCDGDGDGDGGFDGKKTESGGVEDLSGTGEEGQERGNDQSSQNQEL